MFEILFLIIIAAYFIQATILSIGSTKKFKKLKENDLPLATVIVAARNEEDNIYDCLDSLDKLEYPEGKLEILIVDDESTDRTPEIIIDFISNKPKFKLVKADRDFGETKGKARAIANAIEHSTGEVILTTDADCRVSSTWAKTIASYYVGDVVMVCGYTNQEWKNLFEAVQDMDFIYLLTIAAGAINLGKPLSAIGNNMSYKKSAYYEVGGYEKIKFSVTEDFQLLMAIKKLKGKKIIYPSDPNGLVTSKPCSDWKTVYLQKRRWAVGGMNSTLDNLIIISTGFWMTLFTLMIPFFYSPNLIYLLCLKIFTDLFMVYHIYKQLRIKFTLSNFIGFQLYQTVYFTIIGVSLIFSRKVIWKGREY